MVVKPGYKQTEMGVIPDGWEVKDLGDIGDVKMCRRIFSNETSSNGSIPFYKIGTFGKEADAYISQDLYNDYRQKFSFPSKGEILISAAGTIGRTIIYDGEDAYFQDSNIVWIENNHSLILNDFLYHTLQIVKYNTEGGTIKRLYNSILRATKFACPTLAEQSAIAGALSDADVLIESMEQLITKKRQVKQGAMQELLTGKKRLPGFEVKPGYKQTEIGVIPEDWSVTKLGEVCHIFGRIGFRGYTINDIVRKGNGAVAISPSNIKGNLTDFTDCTYISWTKYEESPEIKINNGDIILVKTGSTFGKTAIVQHLTEKATLNPQLVVLKKLKVDNFFLGYSMAFKSIQDQISAFIVGGALPTLSQRMVAQFKIPLPPTMEEQTAIAAVLSDMDAEIAALGDKLTKARQLKQGMMQELLTGRIRLV
jgi:type I restriction enzyme S subunit